MSSNTALNKIKLGFSPLTQNIYIFRHGKDEGLALDKREAEHDVMRVLVDMMMYDAPKGASKIIYFEKDGKRESFEVIVRPVKDSQKEG